MKVTANRPVYVQTNDGKKLLSKGVSGEVDGRVYNDGHVFVKAGYLTLSEEKSKRGRKSKDTDEQPDQEAG